jgi:osmotically-inducible protein OsmY
VTLSGTITGSDTRQRVIDIAKQTPGVSRVEDRPRVAEPAAGIR